MTKYNFTKTDTGKEFIAYLSSREKLIWLVSTIILFVGLNGFLSFLFFVVATTIEPYAFLFLGISVPSTSLFIYLTYSSYKNRLDWIKLHAPTLGSGVAISKAGVEIKLSRKELPVEMNIQSLQEIRLWQEYFYGVSESILVTIFIYLLAKNQEKNRKSSTYLGLQLKEHIPNLHQSEQPDQIPKHVQLELGVLDSEELDRVLHMMTQLVGQPQESREKNISGKELRYSWNF